MRNYLAGPLLSLCLLSLQVSADAAAASVAAIEERLALLKAQLRAAEENMGRVDAAASLALNPQKGPGRGNRRPSVQS